MSNGILVVMWFMYRVCQGAQLCIGSNMHGLQSCPQTQHRQRPKKGIEIYSTVQQIKLTYYLNAG